MSGIYIHIPFCRKACHYCDFHFSTDLRLKEKLIKTICKEAELRRHYLGGTEIHTIYLGGGTPSLLNERELTLLIDTLRNNFIISDTAELTLEANPEDITRDKVLIFKRIGITRLSIGVQTFNEETLQNLNRTHTAKQSEESLDLASEAGITNINADLIFAIPGRDLNILKQDITKLLSFYPKHISAYGLTIEEKTAFGRWLKKGEFKPVDEEVNANEFEYLMDHLSSSGYEQYEISNFSILGFESKHNQNYWKRVPYLGLGPGAHSYNGFSRTINLSNNHLYTSAVGNNESYFEIEVLKPIDHINEYLLTSLRTKSGLDIDFLKNNLKYDLIQSQDNYVKALIANNLALITEQKLQLTKSGKMIADEIIGNLFLV